MAKKINKCLVNTRQETKSDALKCLVLCKQWSKPQILYLYMMI